MKRSKHPSYGTVNVHRVSGLSNLFRSQLQHHQYIELTISAAEVVQNGGAHDFVMPKEAIISVALSESQFAKMITSINLGCGTPCTITRRDNKSVPAPPAEDRAAFVQDGHNRHLMQAEESLRSVLQRLEGMRKAKKRPTLGEMDDISSEISTFLTNFQSNCKYYRDRFVEEMETIVEEAKTEIESHVNRVIEKTGIENLNLPRLG